MGDDELATAQNYAYRIDLRFWLKFIAYTCVAVLMFLGMVVAVALMFMALRFINREPDPKPVVTTTTVTTTAEPTVRTVPATLPPTTVKPG